MGKGNSKDKKEKFLSNEKDFKQRLKENWKRYSLFSVITIYLSGLLTQCVQAIFKLPQIIDGTISKSEIFTLNPFKGLWLTVSSITGILCLLLTIGLVWLGWFYGIKPRMKEETGYEDDRNFRVAEEGTYGTSSFMRRDEMEKVLDIKPIGEQEGNILGQIDGKALSVPSEKEFEKKVKANNWGINEIINNKLNSHIAVIGSSGTMKTRAFVRNLIIQAAKRGESMIITDPKSELVNETSVYLKNKGYKVKMFNLVNLLCSDSWDCLATIGTDSLVAKIFADVVAENAGKGNDAYFVTNAGIILKAVSLYVLESPNETDKTMGRVYDILSSYTSEKIDSLFMTLEVTSSAKRAYDAFKRCNDNVKGQILNNVSAMLSVFQDDAVRDITSSDEIDIENVCYEKSAYFLVMSDQHTSFDFLAVLFYAMSFIKQVEAIDIEYGKKEAGLEYRPTVPINYIMDEFSNLGQIPDFVKKISTVRSRKINISVIVQNVPQLMNRYPNNQWQEILGCCDTTIFLGCTDMMTAEYISKKAGIATIEVESTNSVYDRQVMILNQATGYHEVKSRGQRKVLNEDEVLRLKNTDELIFLRGQKPIICQKFDYTLHPESKKFIKSSSVEHIPEWRKKKELEKAEGRRKADERIRELNKTEQSKITEYSNRPKENYPFAEKVSKVESKPPEESAEKKREDSFMNSVGLINMDTAPKTIPTANTSAPQDGSVETSSRQSYTPATNPVEDLYTQHIDMQDISTTESVHDDNDLIDERDVEDYYPENDDE